MSKIISGNSVQAQIGKAKGEVSTTMPLVCNDMQLTDWFIKDCSKGWLFLIATFPLGQEPLISGFGVTKEQAWELSRNNMAYEGELCVRTSDTFPTWKSSTGKIVTMNHISRAKRG